MKLQIIFFVALIGLLSSMTVNSQTTTASPTDAVCQQIKDQMKKLKSDLKDMKSTGTVDDQKLITDVTAVVKTMQDNIKLLPASMQAEATAGISEIQTKIQAMTKAGKFDQSIMKSIHDAHKSAKDALKSGKTA